MKTIAINSTTLAQIILDNKSHVGSTDWDIYVNNDGTIDCRHNTHSSDGWYEIVDLYSFWDDDDTLNSDVDELAAWLESDAIDLYRVEDEINHKMEVYDDFEPVSLVWS